MNRTVTARKPTLSISELKKAGIPIVSGKEFGLGRFVKRKNVSIEQVRKILSKFRGSLAEEVSRMREQE